MAWMTLNKTVLERIDAISFSGAPSNSPVYLRPSAVIGGSVCLVP
jgi:hypothetical protein